MRGETAAAFLEGYRIPMNPTVSPVLVGGLSLVIPGLGQAYLGQWSRGLRVFGASATLCFGLGLANAVTAYDAYSLANRNQVEDITTRTSSKTLMGVTVFWAGFCVILDALIDTFSTGPGFLLAFPLMILSHLAGGKGFQR